LAFGKLIAEETEKWGQSDPGRQHQTRIGSFDWQGDMKLASRRQFLILAAGPAAARGATSHMEVAHGDADDKLKIGQLLNSH
jgi:hypothetical protein